MKPKVYLESTFVSLLTAWPSRDLLRAAQQQSTRDWWISRRNDFDMFVSQVVLDEIAMGDSTAASDREHAIAGLPVLHVSPAVEDLTRRLVESRSVPSKAGRDAAHIAVAAVHQMHFLLTWNFRHINNAVLAGKIRACCEMVGFTCPVICTPDELMRG
jgi:hypothetical protein